MRKFDPKKTIGSSRQELSRSKERDKEAADDDKDLISSLPLDLKLEILAKSSPISIAQFISVSKLWSSIVRGKDLTDLFLSRSSTRPSFLFTFRTQSIHGFHTEEEPSSGNRKISITIPNPIFCLSPPVRGLICGQDFQKKLSKVICNPSTGQFVKLPRVQTRGRQTDNVSNFLGYDPVNDQYKVLCAIQIFNQERVVLSEEHQVFTLGAKEERWRVLEWKHQYCHDTNGICRDGVIYYGANCNSLEEEGSVILSFDVRSEVLSVMKLPADVIVQRHYETELVNYDEGIALVDDSYIDSNIDMWVLKDVKKQEWTKVSFLLPDVVWTWSKIFYCKGTISTGEIVFAPNSLANPFFLVYYDLKRNSARRVVIGGVRDNGCAHPITVFLNHVVSPRFLS